MYNKHFCKPALFFAAVLSVTGVFAFSVPVSAEDKTYTFLPNATIPHTMTVTSDTEDSSRPYTAVISTDADGQSQKEYVIASDLDDASDEDSALSSTIFQDGDVIIDDEAYLGVDKDKLDEKMQKFTTYGKAVFVSSSYGYENASDISSVYDQYIGLGKDGMLLLIDMTSRQILIYTDGAVKNTITSNYATTIADSVYEYASKDDYDGMAVEAFSEATRLMGGEKLAQPMKIVTSILLAVALGLFISFLIAEFSSGAISSSHTEFSMHRVNVYNKRKTFIRENREYAPRDSGGNGSGGDGGHSGGDSSSGGGHSGGSSGGSGGGHSF